MNNETTTVEETKWEAFKKWQFPSTGKNILIALIILLTNFKIFALVFYPFAYCVAKHEKRNLYSFIYVLCISILPFVALLIFS